MCDLKRDIFDRGGSRGAFRFVPPPDQNVMQVLGKIGQIVGWYPLFEFGPPLENPGSTSVSKYYLLP